MSQAFELTGRLVVIDDEQQISTSFKKREFVIEVENERNTDWNDFVKFQLVQDKCDLMNSFNVGDTAKVSFNVKGRKWEKDGKVNYFNSLDAWRIDTEQASTSAPQQDNRTVVDDEGDEGDILPF